MKNINFKVKKAKTFYKKLIGFMFKKEINHGLLFYNTRSIHTFFCFKNLTIIMLDKNFKVLHLFLNTPKNKIILGKKNVYYTLELPHNININIKEGDIINLTNLEK